MSRDVRPAGLDPVPRRPLIGASWKMHLTPSEADAHLARLVLLVPDLVDRDLFVLPAHPALAAARARLAATPIAWGAQDVHHEDAGAWTGDVSAPMLADLGCRYVEVGHPERRRAHGETRDQVAGKVAAVVRWGMVPIVCVGDVERADPPGVLAAVLQDLERCLAPAAAAPDRELVVAFEPPWAIGAGMAPASTTEIAFVHRGIRDWLAARGFERARVIYGGSVDPTCAADLLAVPGVDGLFVGRASLDPEVFAAIARAPVPRG